MIIRAGNGHLAYKNQTYDTIIVAVNGLIFQDQAFFLPADKDNP